MNKKLIPIFLTVTADVFGLTLVIPILPFYAKKFGASPFTVGLLFASFAICQLISGPILGKLSDNYGRKKILLISQIGTFFGFLFFGLANSLLMLFVARMIDGSTAGNLSIAQAYISDVTKPEERTKAFAFIGIAFGLGFLVGPALSGYLSQFGYHYPPFAAAFLSLTSILCTIFLLPDVPATSKSIESRFSQIKRFFGKVESRNWLLSFFAFTLSFSTFIAGVALFLNRQFGYDAKNVGYIYAFSGLVGVIIQGGFIGRLVKIFGDRKLSMIGFTLMGLSFVTLWYADNLTLLLINVVVGSIGSAFTRPSITTLITKSVKRDEQGAVLGVSQSMASVAQIIGAVVSGWLIEHDLIIFYCLAAGGFALMGTFISTISSEPPHEIQIQEVN